MNRAILTCVTREGRPVVAPLDAYLSPDRREAARLDANAWIKRLRLVPYRGVSMRDRFTYRGDSLWWFTELYLHKMRRLDTAVATVLALEAARDQHGPAGLIVDAENLAVREAARAFGAAARIPVELRGSPAGRPRGGWSSYLIGLTARLSRWRPSRGTRPVARPAVAAFVHTAFWRPDAEDAGTSQETYIGPVLDALAARVAPGDLQCIGVGPRRNFRARRWWDPVVGAAVHAQITPIERLAPSGALTGALELWRQRDAFASALVSGEAIRAAAVYRGCDLWPVLEPELDAAARLQWPWSARAMDEAGAALDALSPRVVLTYAEAGGWGRALVLEARRRRVPSVGLQHGFIYRHWLNYLHEPDEIAATAATEGCPIPDRTLVFDDYARAHLLSAGHFPDAVVTVTGSARLDDLAARVSAAAATRDATRASLFGGFGGPGGAAGLADAEARMVVLTAKHSEMGTRLADLLDAVRGLTAVRLVIKPHPAETPDVYAGAAAGVPNVSIADARADLARLLAAADAVVTMNSTVAIDGLVLGIPALVIGRPTNLSPFVDAGVMAGADGADAIRAGLGSVLYDAGVRQSLAEAARRFTGRFGMRADGRAADRTAAEILALAHASHVTPSDHA